MRIDSASEHALLAAEAVMLLMKQRMMNQRMFLSMLLLMQLKCGC
jgi:hypothetical protein